MRLARAGLVVAIMALAAAATIGAWRVSQPPASSIPEPTAVVTSGPPPTQPAAQTAVPVATAPSPLVVYFAREDLPPLRGTALGSVPARNTPEDRIGARVSALWSTPTTPIPDAFNPFGRAGRSGSQGSLGVSTRIEGDLATVTFDLPAGWGVSDARESLQAYQQLVYTISEEPGIRRVLIAEAHKPQAVIGTITVTGPVTRDDVVHYRATVQTTLTSDGPSVPQEVADVSVAIDGDPFGRLLLGRQQIGVGRVGVLLRPLAAVSGRFEPRFAVSLERCDPPSCDGGSWTLSVTLPDATWPASLPTYAQTFDRMPIRSVRAATFQGGTVAVAVRLDAALPWRVSSEVNSDGSALVLIDVGGHVSTTSDSVALYLPTPGQGMGDRAVGCTCAFDGVARTVADVVGWRVRDGSGQDVAHGTAQLSRSSTSAWGTFKALVTVPPRLIGDVAVELFTPLAGVEGGLVRVPITLH